MTSRINCYFCSLGREGWRIGWITVHDADGAFAAAGVPDTLLKLCQAVLPATGFQFVKNIQSVKMNGSKFSASTV